MVQNPRTSSSSTTPWRLPNDSSDMDKHTRDSQLPRNDDDHPPRHPNVAPNLVTLGTRTAPLLQLGGSDPYTKELMTRLATGSATPMEQRSFEEWINEARASGIKVFPQTPKVQDRSSPFKAVHGADPRSSGGQRSGALQTPSAFSKTMASQTPSAFPISGASHVCPTSSASQVPSAFPTPWAFSTPSASSTPAASQLPSAFPISSASHVLPTQSAFTTPSAFPKPTASQIQHVCPAPSASQLPSTFQAKKGSDRHIEPNASGLSDTSDGINRSKGSTKPKEEARPYAPGDRYSFRDPAADADLSKKADLVSKAAEQSVLRDRSTLSDFFDKMNLGKKPAPLKKATPENAAVYCKPFCEFLTKNPTVFHCVAAMKKQLLETGYKELSERDAWNVKPSGKYYVERNGSSLIAFVVGAGYKPGEGCAILAGHVDALTAKLKPISAVPNKAGYLQLGVAPYAGGLGPTWWDRDLGIGGKVIIKEGNKMVTKLVKLDWPIAKIPTLAPHFGAPAGGPFNLETNMVPIIGLEGNNTDTDLHREVEPFSLPSLLGSTKPVSSFVQTQPPALVRAISKELGLTQETVCNIVNWELELFDVQPATVGGLDKEFIFAGRIDDKLCSWAALQALIETQPAHTENSSILKVVGLFDDEEIGSLLRQGARGNFLPSTIERAVSSLANNQCTPDLFGRTYANSFLVSSDVTHAVNPNFLNVYLENHAPHLNVGLVVSADSNGHMTTDSVSTAILQRCAGKVDAKLQVFQIRNDSRSGGTVGPMLSAATGIRAIDAGIPQLSMHSIRATTGSLDPGLGVLTFAAFLNSFEEVDREFRA